MKTKFLVQVYVFYEWVYDAGWSTTDGNGTTVPLLFDTREEAQAEINDRVRSLAKKVAVWKDTTWIGADAPPNRGMWGYEAYDYRIVEVDPATWKREEQHTTTHEN